MLYVYLIEILGKVYVGSCMHMKKRIRNHIYDCYNEKYKGYNCKLYQFIRDNNIDFNESHFRVIYAHPYSSSRIWKQYFINKFNSVNIGLNMVKAWALYKDYNKNYYNDNKEHVLEYSKEYYKINKERILERLKHSWKCPECNKVLRYGGKARHLKIHNN